MCACQEEKDALRRDMEARERELLVAQERIREALKADHLKQMAAMQEQLEGAKKM